MLNKSSSPLEYLHGLICQCICTPCPTISVIWILISTDNLILGLSFSKFKVSLSIAVNFYRHWKSKIFPNCIPRDVELVFGDSVGSNAWYLFSLCICMHLIFGWNFFWFHQKKWCMRTIYIQYIHNTQKNALHSSVDIFLAYEELHRRVFPVSQNKDHSNSGYDQSLTTNTFSSAFPINTSHFILCNVVRK